MKSAVQSSMLPTRKLAVAAAVGPATGEVWARVMTDIYPALAGPQFSLLVATSAALFVGYWVKDAPNIPVSK